jgi:hypothetical protein
MGFAPCWLAAMSYSFSMMCEYSWLRSDHQAALTGHRPPCFGGGAVRRLRALAWRTLQMASTVESISNLLHEAGETHHRVYRIIDGADDDWASWYADWLVNLSELPDLLGVKPVRSELTFMLVSLGKQYSAEDPSEPWEAYYARQIIDHFRPNA